MAWPVPPPPPPPPRSRPQTHVTAPSYYVPGGWFTPREQPDQQLAAMLARENALLREEVRALRLRDYNRSIADSSPVSERPEMPCLSSSPDRAETFPVR